MDFFGSANTVSIDARDRHGLPASLDDRHSVGVLGRVLQVMKASAGPFVAALAVASAIAMTATPVQTIDAGAGNMPQSVHAMSASLTAARAGSPSSEVQSPRSEPDILLLNAYDASIRKVENREISETEMGMSQKAIHDLALSMVSPDAKKHLERLDVIDKDLFTVGDVSPNMLVLENKARKNVCILQVGGFNKELSELMGAPVTSMSAKDAMSLRRVVIVHEAAHCEHRALLHANAAGSGPNFVADMNNVASGFSAVMPDKHVVDYSNQVKTLMWERYADSKVVLALANSHLSHLRETSSSAERNEALSDFKQDISQMKRLRIQERTLLLKNGKTFDDHDTLHVVETLESTVISNAKDPEKWKVWSGKYLGEEQMAPTAGAIALGSVLAERNEIARENIKIYGESIKGESSVLMERVQYNEKILTRSTEKLANANAEFEGERMSPGADPKGQKPGVSADEYLSLYMSHLDAERKRVHTASHLSETEHLSDSVVDKIEMDAQVSYPAYGIALKSKTYLNSLETTKDRAQATMAKYQDKQVSLKSVMEALQPGVEIKQAIGGGTDSAGLSDAAKSFSMKGHSFWTQTQSQSAAAGDIHKSFLMANVREMANDSANKSEPSKAKSGIDTANFLSSVPRYAARVPVASGLLKILGAPRPGSSRPLVMSQPQQ